MANKILTRPGSTDCSARLTALRRAAKQGFDELDHGSGFVLQGKRALDRFFKDLQDEVTASDREDA